MRIPQSRRSSGITRPKTITSTFRPPQGGPVTARWLQIFPPNQTVPIYLHYTAPACANPVPLLTVNTVRAGSGG
jgi:hypothetical protein